MSNKYKVAVVGATGAVGETMLAILAERRFPISKLVALASERSAGSYVDFVKGERRFAAMAAKFPEEAEKLFRHAQKDAQERYETYAAMSRQK